MVVKKIIIHHSATKDYTVNDWAGIKLYHTSWRYNGNIITAEQAKVLQAQGKVVEAPWLDIAYHYGIENVNGKYLIQKGREEWVAGAHTVGQNTVSLGICVVGDYDKVEPNPEALKLLAKLCADICKRYKLTPDKIETHNKYASYKTCPGTAFPMVKLRAMVKDLMK